MSFPTDALYLVETVEKSPRYLASFSTRIEAVSFADGFVAGDGGKTINVRLVKPGSGTFLYGPHNDGAKAEVPTDGG